MVNNRLSSWPNIILLANETIACLRLKHNFNKMYTTRKIQITKGKL